MRQRDIANGGAVFAMLNAERRRQFLEIGDAKVNSAARAAARFVVERRDNVDIVQLPADQGAGFGELHGRNGPCL